MDSISDATQSGISCSGHLGTPDQGQGWGGERQTEHSRQNSCDPAPDSHTTSSQRHTNGQTALSPFDPNINSLFPWTKRNQCTKTIAQLPRAIKKERIEKMATWKATRYPHGTVIVTELLWSCAASSFTICWRASDECWRIAGAGTVPGTAVQVMVARPPTPAYVMTPDDAILKLHVVTSPVLKSISDCLNSCSAVNS
ncbi:hypothetical protein J6590_057944 [Homalodisca vitripennis]|nr:hypothetical protein J6590_057944 [Homalodisca vitripennis]